MWAAFSPPPLLGGSSADSSRYFFEMLEFLVAVAYRVAVEEMLVCAS